MASMAATTMGLITMTMPQRTDQAVLRPNNFIMATIIVDSHEGIRKPGREHMYCMT